MLRTFKVRLYHTRIIMKDTTLYINDFSMNYISFGKGKKNLILIPGLGDGLTTVKGTSIPFSILYQAYTKDYTVYSFSSRNEMEEGHTTKDMAMDLKKAMDALNLTSVDVVGVSQGGMIAQELAILYPEVVNKLVLVVTTARKNDLIEEKIEYWKDLVLKDDYKRFMDDNVKQMYSDAYYKKNKWMVSLVSLFTKPKSFKRFLIMADACVSHNTYHELDKIQADTLIIGGKLDQVVGYLPSIELNKKIKDSECYIYENYGHALYEEASDFNTRVLTFLRK